MTPTQATAAALLAQGVASIPTLPYDDKDRPKACKLASWREFQNRLPTVAEQTEWFKNGASLAILGGPVTCLDLDTKNAPLGWLAEWNQWLEESGLSELFSRLVQQATPSGGKHYVWRCSVPVKNVKLAETADRKTVVETRGAGGYFLAYPSKGYHLTAGSWASIPVITPEEQEDILTFARSFNKAAPTPHRETPREQVGADSPGSDFNARGDVTALLVSHGWTHSRGDYFTRPGKARGVSASWNRDGNGHFVCFSSDAHPFAPSTAYLPFAVYALLEHGGDYAAAAKELRRKGYGAKPSQVERVTRFDAPEPLPQGITVEAPKVDKAAALLARLDAVRFNIANPPPVEPWVFRLGGVELVTTGNSLAIAAAVKSGKSSFQSAMLATLMGGNPSRDYLGLEGRNEGNKAVLHFDTEQSKGDHFGMVQRAVFRAGVAVPPAEFASYHLRSFTKKECRLAVFLALKRAYEERGVCAAFVDGVADLCADVNDAEESGDLVAELQRVANEYNCALIGALHHNPGTEKTRGHLGSEWERKASGVVHLKKEDEVITANLAPARHAPLVNGVKFAWSDEHGRHILLEGDAARKTGKMTKKEQEFLSLAREIIATYPDGLSWSGLKSACQRLRGLDDGKAQTAVNAILRHKFLTAGERGIYTLSDDLT